MHLWHTIYTFRCVWVLPTHSQEAPPSQHGFAVVPENVHELLFRFETGFEISRVHSKLVTFWSVLFVRNGTGSARNQIFEKLNLRALLDGGREMHDCSNRETYPGTYPDAESTVDR